MNIFLLTVALMAHLYAQENPQQVDALKTKVSEAVQVEMSEDGTQVTFDVLSKSATFDYEALDYSTLNN